MPSRLVSTHTVLKPVVQLSYRLLQYFPRLRDFLAYLARLVLLVCGEGATKPEMEADIQPQQQASLRHIDEFVGGLQCAGELIDLELYPDVKEVSESMAAFHAVRRHMSSLSIKMNQKDVGCIVVGDGSTPRTAALFAYRTSWKIWSIDPQLNAHKYEGKINHLNLLDRKIEDCHLSNEGVKAWVIVCVHAHLRSLQDAVDCCIAPGKPGKLALVVAMPCCNNYSAMLLDSEKNDLGPMEEYKDWGVLSPHRVVRVWMAADGVQNVNSVQDESVKSTGARSKGGSVRAQRSRKRREQQQQQLLEADHST